MPKLFQRTQEPSVKFCNECGSVGDSACRANGTRDGARQKALGYGPRLS